MFKITPVSDIDEARSLCESLALPYFEGAFYYKMFDMESGNLMGLSVFELYAAHGEILALKESDGLDDFEAMFILTRQTMNFINLCGHKRCIATVAHAPERLLTCAGFKSCDEGKMEANLEGMFDGHCHTSAK